MDNNNGNDFNNNDNNQNNNNQYDNNGGNYSSDNRTLAIVAHLLGFFTSFVGPLVIYLAGDKSDTFTMDNAREALNFQITVAIAYVVSGILIIILIGGLMMMAVGVINLVFCIMAVIKASNGEVYRYPFTIRFVK